MLVPPPVLCRLYPGGLQCDHNGDNRESRTRFKFVRKAHALGKNSYILVLKGSNCHQKITGVLQALTSSYNNLMS